MKDEGSALSCILCTFFFFAQFLVRARVAQMIVAEELFRRNVGEALDAAVPSGALRKLARRFVV